MLTGSDGGTALRASVLRKDYTLGEFTDVTALLRRILPGAAERAPKNRAVFSALDDVSFTIERGDCVAILGSNGSGKSTLAQIISGITVPSGGTLEVRGRVLPLLEVGGGFNDELTGRENVVLFGTVLGLDRSEIEDAMPAIAEFGGIDELHMHTPLKRYSTGMRARLSFAVAMRFPADIFIFDEVIAVVDDAFHMVAVQEIDALIAAGRTVLFISHDTPLVRSLCNKGLWLDRGRVRAFGAIEDVVGQYSAAQASA